MSNFRVVRYRSESQAVIAVLKEGGHKWTHAVWIDCPIRLRKIKKADAEKYSTDMPNIQLKTTCTTMLRSGMALGITKGAERLLKEARK